MNEWKMDAPTDHRLIYVMDYGKFLDYVKRNGVTCPYVKSVWSVSSSDRACILDISDVGSDFLKKWGDRAKVELTDAQNVVLMGLGLMSCRESYIFYIDGVNRIVNMINIEIYRDLFVNQ